jgi:DNA ligase (NAD+)
MFAIGIRHVGEFGSKLIAKNFRKLEDLYNISTGRLIDIKQMGDKIAEAVSEFFSDKKNIETLETLKRMGIRISNPDFEGTKTGNKPFSGLTFVITGTYTLSRNEIKEFIENNGGHTASSVSKKTDFVVAGEKPGSKFNKANDLGVKVITYDELIILAEKKQGSLF